MTDNHDTLIRQVEEELRREQLEKLLDRYAPYAAAAAVAIVVGVGGWKFLESRRIAAAQAAGERYEAALALVDEGKATDAATAFAEIAKGGAGGYAALARLQAAGAAVKAGQTAEALAAYEALAKNAGDKLIADYAALQAAALRVGDADFTEIENRLTGLTVESGPWRSSARELLGTAAYKAGKLDVARTAFEQVLADRGTPPGVSERVQVVLGRIVAAELAKTAGGAAAADAKAGAAQK
jgi:hypothetical protein